MITLEQLPEDFTPQQFMQLDRAGLDAIPYELKQWRCSCKGCEGGTTVRDYGILPFVLLHRNSKKSQGKAILYWNNLNRYIWFCSKHNKFLKRLLKRFTYEEICNKIVDNARWGTDNLITINAKA